jgi:transposase
MTYYAGLDVSLEQTSVCVVDDDAAVVWERRVATDPAAIAEALATLPMAPARALLETGGLTPWLWHELGARGVVVHCIDARRAKAQLALRPAKTDRGDARGLAEIARMGWYADVRVKSLGAHALRAKLAARAHLVASARDLANQLRGLLRCFGLIVGKGKGQAFEGRVLELVESCPALRPMADALLAARRAVLAEAESLDRVLLREARQDGTCRRLMTVPGVGPITALAYQSTIEDPGRFGRARDVGAYVGLVPRRHQSGEVDRSGRISKQGDALLRGYLYEAATVLMRRLRRPCALQAWARALAERIGVKKARVALARKLAVLLHHLWSHEEDFRWARPVTA